MFSNELDAQVGNAGGVAAWMAQTRDLGAQAAARALGLRIHIVQASTEATSSEAWTRLGVGALVVLPDAAMR